MPTPEHPYSETPPVTPESPRERLQRLLDEWSFEPWRDQEGERQLAKEPITLLLDYFVAARDWVRKHLPDLDAPTAAEVQEHFDETEQLLYTLIFAPNPDNPHTRIDDVLDDYRFKSQRHQEVFAHAYFTVLRRLLITLERPLDSLTYRV